MSARVTRATVAGRVYLDLQNLARRWGRPTDELHQIYALEGFLVRLSTSSYSARLVLKGGVLLAAYDTRRPTRDVDLQGQHLPNDVENVLEIVREIASIEVDDGLSFDVAGAMAETIRDDEEYSGVRVTIGGRLATAQLKFHVDVNVGDPISPAPVMIDLPRLLEGSVALVGYPLSMIHAEKVMTAVQRGQVNTRWRDFADVYALARRHDVDGGELTAALARVADHRQIRSAPLCGILDGFAGQAQRRWGAWRRKHRLDERLPEDFRSVLDLVIAFADPALLGQVSNGTWRATELRWVPKQTM